LLALSGGVDSSVVAALLIVRCFLAVSHRIRSAQLQSLTESCIIFQHITYLKSQTISIYVIARFSLENRGNPEKKSLKKK